jgi:hypothetical protein
VALGDEDMRPRIITLGGIYGSHAYQEGVGFFGKGCYEGGGADFDEDAAILQDLGCLNSCHPEALAIPSATRLSSTGGGGGGSVSSGARRSSARISSPPPDAEASETAEQDPEKERLYDIRRPPSPTSISEYRDPSYGGGASSGAHGGDAKKGAGGGGGAAVRKVVANVGSVTSSSGNSGNAPSDTSFGKQQEPSVLPKQPGSSKPALSSPATGMSPLYSTMESGPLFVPALSSKEVRTVSCGFGFTIATVATEWMKHEEAPACMRCVQNFTLSRRRHHCRNCGGIFCDACTSQKIPLLKLGHIAPVRVCDGCYARILHE